MQTHDAQELAPLLEPSPCDSCRYRDRCSNTGEACNAFRAYVSGASEARWRLQPTQPRRDVGRQLGLEPRVVDANPPEPAPATPAAGYAEADLDRELARMFAERSGRLAAIRPPSAARRFAQAPADSE